MNAKKANIIFGIMLVSGALISGIGSTEAMQWMSILGIALMMGGLLVRILMYRCPHCGKYLDRSTGDFCPYCGKKIVE